MPLAAILSALPNGGGSANSPPVSLLGNSPPRWPSRGRRARVSPRCGAPEWRPPSSRAAAYCVASRRPARLTLSFAGLSDLLVGVLPVVGDEIPAPQREALEVALLLRPAGDEPPTARAVSLAVLAALRSCLQGGPVLAAIEDVQWLDVASLEALAFALRRVTAGPLGLLLAARTEAPADPLTVGAAPLPHGWRDLLAAVPATQEIELTPLDMWQVQNLLPRTVTAAQVRLVASQSRGNPFWAREIAATLDLAEAPLPPLARTLTDRLSRSLTRPAPRRWPSWRQPAGSRSPTRWPSWATWPIPPPPLTRR